MSEKEFVEVQQKPTLTQSTDNGMSAFLREVNDEFR